MKLGRIAGQYLVWHYSVAFDDLWRVFCNFLWFVWNLFSISFLLKTLFDPFERIREGGRAGDGVQNFFSALAVNVTMRIVGVCARLMVVVMGVALLLLTLLLGVCAFVLWPLLPGVVAVLFVLSVSLLL
ncbi:MAG: hypothetical protein WCI89_03250 [bacterium]